MRDNSWKDAKWIKNQQALKNEETAHRSVKSQKFDIRIIMNRVGFITNCILFLCQASYSSSLSLTLSQCFYFLSLPLLFLSSPSLHLSLSPFSLFHSKRANLITSPTSFPMHLSPIFNLRCPSMKFDLFMPKNLSTFFSWSFADLWPRV